MGEGVLAVWVCWLLRLPLLLVAVPRGVLLLPAGVRVRPRALAARPLSHARRDYDAATGTRNEWTPFARARPA